MTNLAQIVRNAQAAHGSRLAVRQGPLTMTYEELAVAAGRAAALLRETGVQPGDRVGLMLPNVLAFPVLFYGSLAAGVVVVPMNPLLKSREVAHYLGDAGATVIFAWDAAAGEAAKGAAETGAQVLTVTRPDASDLLGGRTPDGDWASRDDEDDAVILYTSGTTGRPKGAQLTHANLRRNAEVAAVTLLTAGPDDVIMGCLPLFHCFGLTCGLNTALLSGASLSLLPRFDPGQALAMIADEGVTVFEGVPTMYSALLQHPGRATADTSTLRLCVSGGAALPVEVLRSFEEAFGCIILEGYGLSETSPVASFNHPDAERKPGSIGTPIAGVQMRLVGPDGADTPAGEVGEIAIAGHNVMKGYWGKPEATAEAIPDGWFRTGDLARRDEDGYYYIVDRKKELIIRGGYNVYPREVEEALYEHPAVSEVAVVGIPHESLGEEVGAAVALKAGAQASPDELRAFARDRLAAYKYPRQVWLVDELPKGPTGKILRREVRPPAAPAGPAQPAQPAQPKGAVVCAAGAAGRVTGVTGVREAVGEAPDEVASALDLMLSDAALGILHRFRPNLSLARFGLRLARQPGNVSRRTITLAGKLAMIAAGRSPLGPHPKDRRFADPAWTGNPVLRRILQAYLVSARTAELLLADAALDWPDSERAGFVVRNLVDAAAPSNNPLLSPAAWKAVIDTGGLSAVRGARALAGDLATPPRIPAMVEPDAFEVGKDLAATPGAVVHRTEIFELIQYQAATPKVHRFPVLIVPPMINKFYITDLAPGRSMIEYLVGEGFTVFAISWRNPDARHRDWGLDAYGEAVLDALDASRAITGAAKASLCALCSGGILSAMIAAYLGDTGRAGQLASLYLGVTVLDQTPEGTVAALIDEPTAELAVAASRARGYLDGAALAEVFAWLRPNDLIWNYWVNNYLQGRPPPAFDILYWNADTTRMPAALHRDFIRLAMAGALAKPDCASLLGVPVNLATAGTDAYVVAGIADHLCPWQSCYRSTQLLGGDVRFVLSTSGHIASMVNPPGNQKARFQAAPQPAAGGRHENPADPRAWLAAAETTAGSWWTDYARWLAKRSGGKRNRSEKVGGTDYLPLDQAPGQYVLDR